MSASGDRRGGLAFVAVGVVALVTALIWAGSQSTPEPFDPRSDAPTGWRAMVLLLEGQGAAVEVVPAGEVSAGAAPRFDTVLVPRPDIVGDETRAAWRRFAAAGGHLVLGGDAPVVVEQLARIPAEPTGAGRCDLPELGDLESIDTYGALAAPVEAGRRSCFGDGATAHVIEERTGAGRVTTLSSPVLFSNARLQPDKERGGRALDNGPLAVQLAAAAPGATVAVVAPEFVGGPDGGAIGGDRTPWSYLPIPVQAGLWQLVVAFAFYCWWRARRHGRVVEEPMPVEVESSEFTAAVGDLLRRRRRPEHAAGIVRATTARMLRRELGLPPDAPYDTLVRLVAAHTGRGPAEVDAVLHSRPVGDGRALTRLVGELDDLHRAVGGTVATLSEGPT